MTTAVLEISEVASGVVQLKMQDRANRNMFSPELVDGLIEAFETICRSDDLKVVIVTGYDTYFCAGGTKETLMQLHEGRGRFSDNNLYRLPLDCPIPVIAAMQGHAIGGGLTFGLFADVVCLSRESTYTVNYMRYGATPGMGSTYVLREKLGASLATEMLLSGRSYRGDELARRGIPFAVLPRSEVLTSARELACELAETPRLSLTALKAHLVRKMRRELAETVEAEVAMHAATFCQDVVRTRILDRFGA